MSYPIRIPQGSSETRDGGFPLMFDTSRALADMANQVRACRASEGLTLQQLATRSGVAASTIHKVEAQQMVPTVSVLLKISKGLGCRPEQLIRDRLDDLSTQGDVGDTTNSGHSLIDGQTYARDASAPSPFQSADAPSAQAHLSPGSPSGTDVGVWHIEISRERGFPSLNLDPAQRAILILQGGQIELQIGGRRVRMAAGNCLQVQGGPIYARSPQAETANLMLIVSPPGSLSDLLGTPQSTQPAFLQEL